jgi:plasmid stabilization system protein ParE
MKQYKIVITPTAQKDIQTGKNWYETKQNLLGNEFIDAIESAIKKIQSNPRLFSLIYKGIRRAMVKRFPFGIYYFLKDDIINIFAVIHFSRNPKIWKQRTK